MLGYVIAKFTNIAAGLAFGLIQIALVIRYGAEAEIAYFITALTIFSYFSFFDLGFSKPFYARIRIAFCSKDFRGEDFTGELATPALLVPVGAGIMIIALTAYSETMHASSAFGFTAFLSLAFGFNIGLNFYRSLFDAVDKFSQFEKLELIKRVLLLSVQFSIPLDESLTILAALMLSINFALFFCAAFIIHKTYQVSGFFSIPAVIMTIRTMQRNMRDATNYLVFTLSEAISNNLIIILAPFIFDTTSVVLLNLWTRIYRGLSLLSRAVIDIRMHGTVRHFVEGNKALATRRLLLSNVFATFLILVTFTAILTFQTRLIAELSNDLVELFAIHWALMISLIMINIAQHSSGTFLLNIGSQFLFCRNASFMILIAFIGLYCFLSAQFQSAEKLLALLVVVYGSGSVLYVGRTWSILKNPNSIRDT